MIPSDIFTAYFDMGQRLAGQITPYALHLLYLLLIVETATIGLTYMMGSDDPPELLWRLARLLFTGGFAWWWIVNSWALGLSVLSGFNHIGVALTGNPNLNPSAFLKVATQLGKILWDAPSSARLIPNLGLALGEIAIAIVILFVLITVACLAIFTLTAGYLIIGPGSIVIALLPCRFSAPLTEGYFTWLVRTGMTVLFFYIVLGVAQNFVQLWTTTLTTTCAAKLITAPVPTLVGPPIITTAYTCTAPIPAYTLLTLLADVFVLGLSRSAFPSSLDPSSRTASVWRLSTSLLRNIWQQEPRALSPKPPHPVLRRGLQPSIDSLALRTNTRRSINASLLERPPQVQLQRVEAKRLRSSSRSHRQSIPSEYSGPKPCHKATERSPQAAFK